MDGLNSPGTAAAWGGPSCTPGGQVGCDGAVHARGPLHARVARCTPGGRYTPGVAMQGRAGLRGQAGTLSSRSPSPTPSGTLTSLSSIL